MKNITIPIDVSSDVMLTLNESEYELKKRFQATIVMALFKNEKLTFGKATQMSGLGRYEFEEMLSANEIPISNLSIDQVWSDIEELRDL
ncbi:MAG: UPF0175 family protein [Bacteroidales bacterium]